MNYLYYVFDAIQPFFSGSTEVATKLCKLGRIFYTDAIREQQIMITKNIVLRTISSTTTIMGVCDSVTPRGDCSR